MKTFTSNSAKETQDFAKDFAKDFLEGGIIALSGDLGAGKTTFAQGFAEGLGIRDRIISPTFLVIRQYPIPGKNNFFYHIDLYRLENIDLKNSGLEEILTDPTNVVLIEWAERIEDRLLGEVTKISLEQLSADKRSIKVLQIG